MRSLLVLGVVGMVGLLGAAQASAVTKRTYEHSGRTIVGTGTTAGAFTGKMTQIDINQANGNIYVYDNGLEALSQFDADGKPLAFSALGGTSSISVKGGSFSGLYTGGLAVNSTTGNIYSGGEFGFFGGEPAFIRGFASDGEPLGPPFPLEAPIAANCGLESDPDNGDIWMADLFGGSIRRMTAGGVETSPASPITGLANPCDVSIDSKGNSYVSGYEGQVQKFGSDGKFQYALPGNAAWFYPVLKTAIDLSDDTLFVRGMISDERWTIQHWDVSSTETPKLIQEFGGPETSTGFSGLSGQAPDSSFVTGIAVNSTTHDLYVGNGGAHSDGKFHVEIFSSPGLETIADVVTQEPDEIEANSARLRGTLDPDNGNPTTACYFEWGPTAAYGNETPCSPSGPFSGKAIYGVHAEIDGLSSGESYHYRLVVENGEPQSGRGNDISFIPSGPASVLTEVVSDVTSESVRLEPTIDSGGHKTTYSIELGTAPCSSNPCVPQTEPGAQLKKSIGAELISQEVAGLEEGTTYYWRVVAENEKGLYEGTDRTFTTYTVPSSNDDCPNALVRKQTGAALLRDCRAYELVSAANAGGYEVSSDLIAGQLALPTSPWAKDQVLYGLTFGVIPGIGGNPTNFGRDPYLATRTSSGWQSSYLGLSTTAMPSLKSFGSPIASMDSSMQSLAFWGKNICSPCFSDGEGGIPLRRPDGEIVQGMAGSLDPTGFKPDGFLAKHLSADGSLFFFGSSSQFEPDGNSNGDVSIYARDLNTGTTEVISKAPDGSNLACLQGVGNCQGPTNPNGIGLLDVSEDGSRAIVAQRISTDSEGNNYWHPYMHIEGSPNTIDLAPGTTTGVLYAGMSADGSEVYFSTKDQLAGDGDSSADLFRADVGSSSATLERVTAFDEDGCDPVEGADGENWNEVGSSSTESCSVVAISGGGGVPTDGGAIYFLSPEQLDGSEGSAEEPNLYLSTPGGSPQFVATLDPEDELVTNAVSNAEARKLADFQQITDGEFAVFASRSPLTDYNTRGHINVYRYGASGEGIDCVSCAPSQAQQSGDARLSAYGLSIADDGKVFFSTPEQLVLRDTARKEDAYQWSDGSAELISTGISTTDSGLLSASPDGKDVFFFTRSSLSPLDKNGSTMKVYDAREGGGFLQNPPPVPCLASDECHGAGTKAGPAPAIGTYQGIGGNVTSTAPPQTNKCRRNFVKRRGRCVKRSKATRKGKVARKAKRAARNG